MFVSGFYPSFNPVIRPSVGSIVISGIVIDGLTGNAPAGATQILVSKGSVALTETSPSLPSATLSGAYFAVSGAEATQTAAFKIDNDGNFYRRANALSWVQINTSTDWVRPTTGAPASYQARYTGATGDTGFITATAAEDTWYALSSGDFTISVSDATADEAIYSEVSFQLEIRNGSSGSAEASGSYTLLANRADYDPPK